MLTQFLTLPKYKAFELLSYCGQPVVGLHTGIGPPSLRPTMGVATATYVQTRPTIRNIILTARFMGLFS